MGPYLLKSFQCVYQEMLSHGRYTSLERGKVKKGKRWAHDRSAEAINNFLKQFSLTDRIAIAGTDDLAVIKKKKSWLSRAVESMPRSERQALLAELKGSEE